MFFQHLIDAAALNRKVSSQQCKMKSYIDSRRGARLPAFKTGDRVCILKPNRAPKAYPHYSSPVEIKEEVVLSTYLLADDKKWHASRLTKFQLSSAPENSSLQQDGPKGVPTPDSDSLSTLDTHTTSARIRQPPCWPQDYVT